MTFVPFPYQIEGAKWLASKKAALLADEMGLGKTCQGIMAADMINAKRILIICPAIGRINWFREFQKISKIERAFIVETKSKAKWSPDNSIITSFEGACSAIDHGGTFDLIIVDEAHQLKDPKSKRTQKILGRSGIVRITKRIWFFTGTPAPNHYGELWPMLFTMGATKLLYEEFIEAFCITRKTAYGTQIVGSKLALGCKLKLIITNIMMRRKKAEVLPELPQLLTTHCLVEPGEIEVLKPSGVLLDFLTSKNIRDKIESEKKLVMEILNNALNKSESEMLEAIAESIATLRRYTGLQKVFEVSHLLREELAANAYKKIVIFCIHRDVVEGIATKLKEYNPCMLYGGMTAIETQASIDRFQEDPKARVMVANIKSAGTSVTLTAASQVAFCELSWTPSDNAQAISRCHRIGAKSSVFVRFFSLDNFIDERVNEVLVRKTQELAAIF